MTDYRLISLINCSVKLLTKVLFNRLKGVLGTLVSECQSAFIKGRQISDSVLIANEIVHGMKSGRIEGLILKIDFEKAFDSIS